MIFFIIGIIFGYIIGILCNYTYHGPNSNDIKKQIFKDKYGCYRYTIKIHACPIKVSMK